MSHVFQPLPYQENVSPLYITRDMVTVCIRKRGDVFSHTSSPTRWNTAMWRIRVRGDWFRPFARLPFLAAQKDDWHFAGL